MRVSSLHIYPVKAMRGLAVEAGGVGRRGFAGDRRWMVVDAAGEFLTQREHPELATVTAALEPEALVLGRPGAGPVAVDASPVAGERLAVRVWRSRLEALAPSAEADAWLGEVVGQPCRLVYMPDDARRPVNPDYGGPDDIVSFADGYPFLLIEQASLDDLNARLDQPVPMDRFRPNIVVSGADAFAADGWSAVRIGPVQFRVAKPCARCVVTTTDQTTGRRQGPEPLRTLATYRRDAEGGVCFGQNLIAEGTGTVRVGDPVEPVT